MAEFKKPLITISDVPIDAQSFQWAFLSGARSGKMTLSITSTVAEKIQDLKNPVTVSIECDVLKSTSAESGSFLRTVIDFEDTASSNKIKTERVKINLKNLYILEINAESPWMSQVIIGDQRHLWEGKIFSKEFNIHRKTNELKQVNFAAGPESRATTLTFPKERYSPWSLHIKDTRDFANSKQVSDSKGKPWSSMEIVRHILEKELGLKFGGTAAGNYKFETKSFDNVHQIENLSWEMAPITNSLEEVLNSADCGLYQAPEGGMVLYNVGDEKNTKDILAKFISMEGAGWPNRQDLKRVRPGIIRAVFPVEYEIRFDYRETAATGTTEKNNLVFNLVNVLQLPDTFDLDGKEYLKGTWMSVENAITYWNRTDGPHKRKGNLVLSFETIRKSFFTDRLNFLFVVDFTKVNQVDTVWAERIASIKKNYRQTFQIPGYWMDRIKSWKPIRAAVIDPISGIRQPSPVYTNYCIIPSFKNFDYKQSQKEKFKAAANVEGWSETMDDIIPGPFTISVLDQESGVFTISFAQDIQGLTTSVVPCMVDGIPVLSAGAPPDKLLWNGASLWPDHDLSTIFSVVFAEPNALNRHFVVEFKTNNSESKKTQDIPIRTETARFAWEDATTPVFKENQVLIENGELVNEEILLAISKAEVERLVSTWDDLIIGMFTQMGWQDTWLPSGSMRSTTIKFTAQRGLETVFNMSERPSKIDIFNLLPQSIKRYLYKQISQE